jgi:protocatechuate 3,4-dioxygenase beta subunit
MARSKWTRDPSGQLWLPEPNRRAVLTGASASAAALLLGCGDSKPGGGRGPDVGLPGTGGIPSSSGSGGKPSSSNGTGGSPGTGGSSSAPGTGGSGAPDASGGAMDASASDGGTSPGTPSDAGSASDTNATPTPPSGGQFNCTVRPQQIEGPYFRDYKLNRKDIRSDPAAGNAVKEGIPLRMVFKVGQINGMACKAFQNVMVDFWQCDAGGVYSGYSVEGTAGKQFLRGYQMTDGTGTAEFMSIYPGAYSGRAVHVHFKLRTNPMGMGSAFTSQLYFPEMVNDEIFAQAPYRGNRVRNASDTYYRGGGANLIPKMTKEGAGWLAEFEIGLRMS